MTGREVALAAQTYVDETFAPHIERFQAALAGTIEPAAFLQTLAISLERLPRLMQMSTQSLMNAALTAAVARLPVDGFTGQGYIVPFNGRAQFLPGYRGIVTCAGRSMFSVRAEIVRERDTFRYRPHDQTAPIEHEFDERTPPDKRGAIVGAYALYLSNAMPAIPHWMDISEIWAIRDRSMGYRRGGADTPWRTHPDAMIRKTPIRHGGAKVPYELAPDLGRVISLEAEHDAGRIAHLDESGLVRVEPPDEAEAEQSAVAETVAAVGQEIFEVALPDGTRKRYSSIENWQRAIVTWIEKKNTLGDIADIENANAPIFQELRERGCAEQVAFVMAAVDRHTENLRRRQ